MSWSLFVVPVDVLSREGMFDWIVSAEFVHGVPERVPQPLPRPSVAQVLDALRAAGCHGTNWFRVEGEDVGSRLPECPGPATCTERGLDLGEVNLYPAGITGSPSALTADAMVETVTFRKPQSAAALKAVCALAALAGPQLVFDESAAGVLVVWPGKEASELEQDWPW